MHCTPLGIILNKNDHKKDRSVINILYHKGYVLLYKKVQKRGRVGSQILKYIPLFVQEF